ncbi:hypothetical protein BOX15_Mlig027394g2 [Macrostomum lignano]|uniref:Uncharacterized protein n=1 Tax=Macrostomum lignano TaxID=282301 RepID=A0A267F1Q8_9PLAT|nr:hypothetical protein BOX15_Mlig027394g2 [Macrostomum lignano]
MEAIPGTWIGCRPLVDNICLSLKVAATSCAQLQQRLQQEQQRRCEHQQLLLSSNNIAGQQLQDNEQEQQVKDQQESDEARKADTGAPSTVKTYKTAPTPQHLLPAPKPTHKISSDEYLLPTTQLKLRAKASKENLVPAYVAMRETEEPLLA